MKVAIIGYTGSGKSTLAKAMGKKLGIPVLYLDQVNFLPNWVERDILDSQRIVKDFMENTSWVIDGNYSDLLQAQRMEQADKIVFLNFSRVTCFFSAYKRYRKNKNQVREDAAEGCVEKFDSEFAKWILFDSRSRKKTENFREIIGRFSHKTVVIKNRKSAESFLTGVKENENTQVQKL